MSRFKGRPQLPIEDKVRVVLAAPVGELSLAEAARRRGGEAARHLTAGGGQVAGSVRRGRQGRVGERAAGCGWAGGKPVIDRIIRLRGGVGPSR
ncbi:hypothetical protein ACVGVM_10175 [Pseudonocardia bannensis]|uniref:Uncharacterized protein n=1 Tax=Pseudonocardia bannensis TaxID=630973 RepID=A0A848DHL3_9PSEU|nr:hypothetical protein [Pseudonocardia bannensis]NMH92033.1 hypothetical protein [Pseudonocardia bannensis]